MLGQLAQGILESVPSIIEAGAQVIADLLATIGSKAPDILGTGIEIIVELAEGLLKAIPDIVRAVPKIISSVTDTFMEYDWKSIGSNIIEGVAGGIVGGLGRIAEAAKNAARSAYEAATEFLEIHSPSGLMKRKVGAMVPAGIAEGIDENAKVISFDKVGKRIMANARESIGEKYVPLAQASGGTYLDYEIMGEKMKEALSGTAVQMDGKVVGRITAPIVNQNMGQQSELEKRGAE